MHDVLEALRGKQRRNAGTVGQIEFDEGKPVELAQLGESRIL